MVHDFHRNEWLKGGKGMSGLNGGALWKEGGQRFWELMAELQEKKIQLYYSRHSPLSFLLPAWDDLAEIKNKWNVFIFSFRIFLWRNSVRGKNEALTQAEWGNQDIKAYALHLAGIPVHEEKPVSN